MASFTPITVAGSPRVPPARPARSYSHPSASVSCGSGSQFQGRFRTYPYQYLWCLWWQVSNPSAFGF